MSLQGKYYDPQVWGSAARSVWGGSSEFRWFWDTTAEFEWEPWGIVQDILLPPGDPMPAPTPTLPPVISEVPDTWEEYEEQFPEYFEPILETRPGRTPDPYPQDEYEFDEPTAEQEDEMAHDWGHIIRGGIEQFLGGGGVESYPTGFAPVTPIAPGVIDYTSPTVTPISRGTPMTAEGCDGMEWSGAAPPKGYKVVNYCGRGVLRKIRRRRRPRMLSRSDAQDVATIVGLVGKGQMASALINRRG